MQRILILLFIHDLYDFEPKYFDVQLQLHIGLRYQRGCGSWVHLINTMLDIDRFNHFSIIRIISRDEHSHLHLVCGILSDQSRKMIPKILFVLFSIFVLHIKGLDQNIVKCRSDVKLMDNFDLIKVISIF